MIPHLLISQQIFHLCQLQALLPYYQSLFQVTYKKNKVSKYINTPEILCHRMKIIIQSMLSLDEDLDPKNNKNKIKNLIKLQFFMGNHISSKKNIYQCKQNQNRIDCVKRLLLESSYGILNISIYNLQIQNPIHSIYVLIIKVISYIFYNYKQRILLLLISQRLLMGKQFKQARQNSAIKKKKDVEPKEQVTEKPIKQQTQPIIKKEQAKPQSASTKQKQKGKTNRLILRNLVFDINEKHLRKLLEPYGEIVDLNIPAHPNKPNGSRGFAFVEFKSYRSCQKAIKQLNQTMYKGRPLVLDFSISKQKFMTAKISTEDPAQNQNEKIQQQQQEESSEQEINQPNQQQQQIEVNEQQKLAKQREIQDLTSTIFIRNLPLSVTSEDLMTFFSKYGKVKWARVVINKDTNISKGTAFVRMFQSKTAQELIEYSRSYEMFLFGKLPRFKKDPKITLEMDGTIIKLFPSLKRQTIAGKLKERQDEQSKKNVIVKPLKKIKKIKDLIVYDKEGKRNLAFAQLGLWQPNENMSEEDSQRFTAHSREKIQKLKNPNNSVSRTRIILKYLDKNITEERLKDLAHEYLRAYKLNSKELTYCKLMLDQERKRSAGFAFIQFAHEENSKKFVEQLSQNYTCLMSRPYVVEFAVQDSRKMQKILRKKH